MAWSIFTQGGGPSVAVGWATQFLQKLGAPVTPGNLEFVYQWEKSEGGGGKYNPLNQGPVAGKPYLTTTGEQFGGGAADYASWDAGLQGAYDFLHYSNYSGVLQGLMSNNPAAARQALWASPWAASHYGYGSNWSYAALPGGQSVLPADAAGLASGALAGIGSAADMQTCAWSVNTPSLGPLGGGSNCLLTKEAVRGLISMSVFAGGLLIAGLGVMVLVAYGLGKAPGVQRAVNKVPMGKQITARTNQNTGQGQGE